MRSESRYCGKWLDFRAVDFKGGQWEYVTRTTSSGAVCIVATIPGDEPQIVLVRQFRPPINGECIELPAGLIDSGEAPETAALRELEEETGCQGKLLEVGPPVYPSCGLTDESVTYVRVEVTERGEARPEADEAITVLTLPLKNLKKELSGLHDLGFAIDARLWFWAVANNAC